MDYRGCGKECKQSFLEEEISWSINGRKCSKVSNDVEKDALYWENNIEHCEEFYNEREEVVADTLSEYFIINLRLYGLYVPFLQDLVLGLA
jgi:hypothetical protein